MDSLLDFGWTENHAHEWAKMKHESLIPARVIADFGSSLKIATPKNITAELSGKLAHYSRGEKIPKVGDWVAVNLTANGNAVVESVILRRNEIVRKIAGKKVAKQIIAANVDIAFVLLALDDDFSIERLQRFLYQLSINKITPAIILNKADKAVDTLPYTEQLQSLDLPIVICSATQGIGVDEIKDRILPGYTAILLGSSGVGKSTLTNKLLHRDAQKTGEIRASDSTGKHTTVHRELFVLPNGGLLIDTPGIRELQLWGTEEDLDSKYQDIAELSSRCKYSDCTHDKEAGCAIRKALQNGKLDKNHYANYLKMKKELAGLTKKKALRAQKDSKRPRKNHAWQADEDY